MKSAGLSSTFKRTLRQTTKAAVYANHQANHLAAKEKQRSLRLQAEQAQLARQKKERELLAALSAIPGSEKPLESK